MAKGVLVDIPKCVGCESCSVACKLWNELEWDPQEKTKTAADRAEEPNNGLWPEEWTSINRYEFKNNGSSVWRYVKTQCFHCEEPACVSACFSKALQKLPEGPVIYDQKLCVGCRYCMMACPFDMLRYEWKKAIPGVRKCQMCPTRVANNMETACTSVCPTGAITFGDREELLAEAKKRIKENGYIDRVYGEKEAGGTSWLYISDTPFEQMRFRTDVTTKPLPSYTEGYMKMTPIIGVSWAAILAGLFIFNNKDKEPLE
ncbi:Fe-S-cluster-containing hydrogenase subunit [Desulfosporosinus orientis DSM 765]|uniref:Fe-S-cluster-containing hydrogenase subunit n=1 Tax=Desulfosporosinus orientis (strain ATCC 19365 / DSM 765 / NCIMB 8382 / VKM B-1628 / Singapore I) TaxID=768706 RepID=G7WJ33_DESOD|nr:4Fe-4S dicluster domain-containing protein [Desulfosporosinus orientis]AET70345.1 Fe-S-cluster-containing hydrogenase subunit [Desulfosporosinus orientis DSM 765]